MTLTQPHSVKIPTKIHKRRDKMKTIPTSLAPKTNNSSISLSKSRHLQVAIRQKRRVASKKNKGSLCNIFRLAIPKMMIHS